MSGIFERRIFLSFQIRVRHYYLQKTLPIVILIWHTKSLNISINDCQNFFPSSTIHGAGFVYRPPTATASFEMTFSRHSARSCFYRCSLAVLSQMLFIFSHAEMRVKPLPYDGRIRFCQRRSYASRPPVCLPTQSICHCW